MMLVQNRENDKEYFSYIYNFLFNCPEEDPKKVFCEWTMGFPTNIILCKLVAVISHTCGILECLCPFCPFFSPHDFLRIFGRSCTQQPHISPHRISNHRREDDPSTTRKSHTHLFAKRTKPEQKLTVWTLFSFVRIFMFCGRGTVAKATLRPAPSFSSVQFSQSVMFDSLWPHGLQHARLPCPSPTPGACSNSCPSSQWCHPIVSSSAVPFSPCLQSFPASGSFPMNQFFPPSLVSQNKFLTNLRGHYCFRPVRRLMFICCRNMGDVQGYFFLL